MPDFTSVGAGVCVGQIFTKLHNIDTVLLLTGVSHSRFLQNFQQFWVTNLNFGEICSRV